MLGNVLRTPPRVSFTDLSSGTTVEAQFNPTELVERLSATWQELDVPGLSHQPLNFSHTGNETFIMTLRFRAQDQAELDRIHTARRFLKSLCVPVGGADDILGGSPPRVLLVWPQMISMTCILRSVQFTHRIFNRQAKSVEYVAEIQMNEIRDFRITSQEVFEDNQLRFGGIPGVDLEEEL